VSGFHELGDEFAGDEANDEWDAAWAAYTSGADTSPSSGAPLRATLRLPGARVQLRGDVGDEIVALFTDLHDHVAPSDDAMGVGDHLPLVTFTVRSFDGAESGDEADRGPDGGQNPTSWVLEQDATGVCAEGDGPADLARALTTRIVLESSLVDTTQLHLDAALVDLEGTGVLLLGGPREQRDELLYEFLAEGAHYLTNGDAVLRPGTRSARGTSLPLWRRDGQLLPASYSVPVADYCDVRVILVLGRVEDGEQADATLGAAPRNPVGDDQRLSAAETLVALVSGAGSGTGEAMGQLGTLVSGASCVLIDPRDPSACVAAARSAARPARRRLAALFEWVTLSPDPAAEEGRRGRRAEPVRIVHRMVRFDDGAAVDHGDGAGPIVVTTERADALEAEAIAAHPQRPGPEALGLPNCPVGATARAMWSESSLLDDLDDLDVLDGPAAPPSGVVAELVSRELLASDGPLRERVIERHVVARALNDAAVERFAEIVDVASSCGVVPVVVGSLAQAFDGPLPDHFTDITGVDLLVRKDQMDLLAEQLERRGYESESQRWSGSSLSSTADRRLHHSDQPSIVVDLHRTLAAGPFGELVDPEEFHQRAVPVRIGTRWALALHPEHRFVHECVRADRSEHSASATELREVVLSAPRSASLMPATMECSARWGATSTVVSVARRIDAELPGLPAWLVDVARGGQGGLRRREGIRRRRTRG